MADQQSNTTNVDYRSTHRFIRERWVIEGTLDLTSPAHFGSGDPSYFTDMPIMLDEKTGDPLLPGTSIAGALRNYLRERQCGDGKPLPQFPDSTSYGSLTKAEAQFKNLGKPERDLYATALFGMFRGDEDGSQSPLIVFDSCANVDENTHIELRDGVRIDPTTRTAQDKMKYDVELLAAGTTFPLRFELAIGLPEKPKSIDKDADENTKEIERQRQDAQFKQHRQKLLSALASALDGFSDGQIKLGARKTRGFGECKVINWDITRYDLTTKDGVLGWLVGVRNGNVLTTKPTIPKQCGESVLSALQKFEGIDDSVKIIDDARRRARLTATFSLDGSLLIRSGFGEKDQGPDAMHLHSWRGNKKKPILPGTSWAGVLRHRATQIANTIGNEKQAQLFIDELFGPSELEKDEKRTFASRLSIRETVIKHKEPEDENLKSLVQTRVKIDRFTGGAFETALFSEQPLFGNDETRIQLEMILKPPARKDTKKIDSNAVNEAEVGLLLLLLKDLWTSDLPVGGENSVGRGRLKGATAVLKFDDGREWQFIRKGEFGVEVTGSKKQDLENFVNAFNREIKKDDSKQSTK